MQDASERLARIEAVFHDVSDSEPPLREARLQELCGDDAVLLAEVSRLLGAAEREQLSSGSRRLRLQEEEAAFAKRRVGPYQLQSVLGRGGTGAVYLAQRVDGQYEKTVAIKLIDVPLASELFRDRFRQERQILAGLDHPLIAKLLDGGVSDDGSPYLVMDYIDGVPLDMYCRQSQLSTGERLRLFLRICEAVQFAHKRLVVHRDLKPDNILISEDGTPHLLDFGTAKLLLPNDPASVSMSTREGYLSFTPQYASPEQVLGQPVSVASDIYSLGVLLFVLLTGRPPYTLASFSTEEMLRVIVNLPPARPSAGNMAYGPIDADLDCIVLKALRKEPADRYGSIEEFAADIRAWFEGRPVAARQGDFKYRSGKFLRRRWISIATTAGLLGTISIGATGFAIEQRRANAERANAQARSQSLRKLSKSLLSEVDDAVTNLPGSTPLQLILLSRVVEHLDNLAKDAKDDDRVQLDMVNAYTRLAHVQGDPYYQNVGDPKAAMASLDKALAFANALHGVDSKDPAVLQAFANEQRSRSETIFFFGKQDEAEEALKSAIQAYERRLSLIHPTAADLAEVALAYNIMGDLSFNGRQDRDPRAENGSLAAFQHEMALTEEAAKLDPSDNRLLRGQAFVHSKMASVLVSVDPYTALAEARLGLAAQDALPAEVLAAKGQQKSRAFLLRELAIAQNFAGDFDGSIASLENAGKVQGLLIAADPKNTNYQYWMMDYLRYEAEVYLELLNPALGTKRSNDVRNTAKGIALARRSLEINDRLIANAPGNLFWQACDSEARTVLGTLEQRTAQAAEGEVLASEGIMQLRQAASQPNAPLGTVASALGSSLLVKPNSLRDAARTLRAAEQMNERTRRTNNFWLLELAQAANDAGNYEESRQAVKDGIALLPPQPPKTHPMLVRQLLQAELARVGAAKTDLSVTRSR